MRIAGTILDILESPGHSRYAASRMLVLGMERWIAEHAKASRNLRLGLLSHSAAVDARGVSTLDRLIQADLRPVSLFSPEHGYHIRAAAGADVAESRHPDLDIPIHSLYGATRKPRAEWLAELDVLLVDLQDLGVRCYTYLSTLCETLVAASGTGLRIVVLDRPVPLPTCCDGPMLAPGFESFVARVRAPLVTGMTPGEAARWMVRESRLDADLCVVPMAGYGRNLKRGRGWSAWRNPSPAIRSWASAMIYPATVWTEALPALDTGRGGRWSFQALGAPGLKSGDWLRQVRSMNVPGVEFREIRYRSGKRTCAGIRIRVLDPAVFRPVETAACLLDSVAPHLAGQDLWNAPHTRPAFFDQLAGTDRFRKALLARSHPSDIAAVWRKERAYFESARENALLYRTS